MQNSPLSSDMTDARTAPGVPVLATASPTASSNNTASTNNTALPEHLAATLNRTFAADFSFWCQNPTWVCLSSDESTRPFEAPIALLDTLSENPRQPILEPVGENHYLLALPLQLNTSSQNTSSTELVVAIAAIKTAEPERLRQFALVFTAQSSQQAELDRMRGENTLLVDQVTRDFEELAFLRSMAEHLDVSDVSQGLIEMAATIFPLLNGSIGSQSLVLLPNISSDRSNQAAHSATESLDSDPRDSEPDVGEPAYWYGARVVSPEICVRLVSQFALDAEIQPVVKNCSSAPQLIQDFPGVREFVLVRLAAGDNHLGWLLALNRQPHLTSLEVPLSQFEFGTGEASLLNSTASILTMHASNLDLLREKEQLLVHVVRALVTAIDAKDPYTRGHSERVAIFSRELARHVGCDESACQRIYLAGLLHDVGKIGVSDATLGKTGALDEQELRHIQRHPEKGWDILHDLDQLDYVLPGVLHHHERYDGRGYPDQLAAENIPLDARIMAIVDSYDAMTSDRPYRSGMSQEKAEAILKKGAATQWDPKLVEAFFEIMPQIVAIRNEYQPKIPPTRKALQQSESPD